jgi:hypothetical protein
MTTMKRRYVNHVSRHSVREGGVKFALLTETSMMVKDFANEKTRKITGICTI